MSDEHRRHTANGINPVDGCHYCDLEIERYRREVKQDILNDWHDWYWDGYGRRVDEICGCADTGDGGKPAVVPDSLASLTWNPHKVLRAVFGEHEKEVYSVCINWAHFDQERLKDAVSAAAEWAVRYNGDLAARPARFIYQSVGRALREASRAESFDVWTREDRDGDGKRELIHALRVELVSPTEETEDDDGNLKYRMSVLDDPSNYPPQEDEDEYAYRKRREYFRSMLDAFVTWWAQDDPMGAEAFRAVHLNERTLSDVAEDYGVAKSTIKRRADKPYRELLRQMRRGRITWERSELSARAEGYGGRCLARLTNATAVTQYQ